MEMIPDSAHHIKRALVTGATGMVGGALCRALLARGTEVVGFARGEGLMPLAAKYRHVSGDIEDPVALRQAVAGCDTVFHTAGLVPGKRVPAAEYSRVNVRGTTSVTEAAKHEGARLVHVSSINVRAIDGKGSDAYSDSKVEAERVVLEASGRGMSVVVVRPGPVFGTVPGAQGRIIDAVVRGRMPFVPLPNRMMCPVFVEDLALALIAAAEQGGIGEIHEVGGEAVSLRDFVDLVAAASGCPRPRFALPGWVVIPAVWVLWKVRPVTRIAPPANIAALRNGIVFDGASAAERLGFSYTPLASALADLSRNDVDG